MLSLLKISLSAMIIWAASEAGKRGGTWGALLVLLPITSILTLSWVWVESKDSSKVAEMSAEIIWFLAPSCVLFITLPALIKRGWTFPIAMLAGILLTAASYAFLFKIRS